MIKLLDHLGKLLIIFCLIPSCAATPLWSFTPDSNFPPTATVSISGTVLVKYIVSNNSSKDHNLVLKPQAGVTQNSSCILGPKNSPNSTCILSLTITGANLPSNGLLGGPIMCQANTNGSPNPNQCYQPSHENSLVITLSSGGMTTLNTSTANLALSISGLTLDGLPSGRARAIIITNTGSEPAIGLNISYPTLPAGTVVTPTVTACTNGSTLLAGESCTITITPGAIASSGAGNTVCTSGNEPIPGVFSVSATNSNQTSTNVVILGYGCIYQGGFVFAMLETSNNEQSIGGTVVAQTDQAPRFPNGVVWSSNGIGSGLDDFSYDTIPGISIDSTPGTPLPSYNTARNRYNNRYINEIDFPFPPSTSFETCNGYSDGACNSANIITLYNYVNTNYGIGISPYTLTAGPTNPSYYAAGLCTANISGYSKWYLPALCELGSGSSCVQASINIQNILDNLPFLIGDPNSNPDTSCTLGANCLSGVYTSSTQSGPANESLLYMGQLFSNTAPDEIIEDKATHNGVRCARTLIP